MLPAISPAVISHLAMPNSGVRRYAAALQSLVSAGARDRLARAEEPVVRRLCAGGKEIRTLGPSRGQNAVGVRLPETLGCAAAIPNRYRRRGLRTQRANGGVDICPVRLG